jgi:hypothetical protein
MDEPIEDENTIDLSSGIDYDSITIDTGNMNSYNYSYSTIPSSITISGSTGSNYGAIGSSGSFLTSNGLNGTSWSNTNWSIGSNNINPTPGLKVNGDAEFEGKVMINGRNISEFMETISKRLAILVPDPAKLEHFAALKKAYEHYKTLEALCEIPKEEDKE